MKTTLFKRIQIIKRQHLDSVSVYTRSQNKIIKMYLLFNKPDTLIKRKQNVK